VFASGESYRALDSGPKAPKGIALSIDGSSTRTKPTRAQKDDIIYEVHVRSNHSGTVGPIRRRRTAA
jgi:glycogen operon protein